MHTDTPPISQKLVLRIAVVLVVVCSLLAGYFQSRLDIWRTNHLRVLDKFDVQTTKELLEKKVEVK